MRETVMKKDIKKILLISGLFVILIITVVIICFYALGFRITYDPNIITDWTAVGAVGQWCSIAASIFVVYLSAYLTRKFDEKTKDIANSNRAKVELMAEIEKQIDEKIKVIAEIHGNYGDIIGEQEESQIQKRILSYIQISIVVTTEKIAKYIGKTVEETYRLLHKMEIEGQNVAHIGDNSDLRIDDLLWKSK